MIRNLNLPKVRKILKSRLGRLKRSAWYLSLVLAVFSTVPYAYARSVEDQQGTQVTRVQVTQVNDKLYPNPQPQSGPIIIEFRHTEEDLADQLKRVIANRKNSNLSSTITHSTTHTQGSKESIHASGRLYRGKNCLKAFEKAFVSDDDELRYEAIIEMSHLHGPNYSTVGLVFESALLSPHKEVREAAEALLAEYPEPGRKVIREYLLKSSHGEVKQLAQNAAPYSEMILWIKQLPNYINK
jgi:hypothetical protein